ncbi:MAG TPA: tetratricopeptide repeat protein [Candidatus Angelobacter sp.]|nr:tetratricopeptide repeat protein [Candidatus Angelobacter sp.]
MAISKLIPALVLAWMTVVSVAAQTRSAPRPHPATPEERAAGDLKGAEDLLQKQQYPQAEEKLLALAPSQNDNPQFWFDLGFVESQLGKFPEAIKAYKKATELNPKWFQAQQNLGAVMAKSGDFRGAAAVFKIAVTLKPDYGDDKAGINDNKALSLSWMSLAFATAEFDPDEAWLEAKHAAEFATIDPGQTLQLADRIARYGDAQAEKVYLELAAPGASPVFARLVNLYVRQKRYAEAESWTRKQIAVQPSDVAAQIELGEILAAEGKTQEAIATLEPAYKSHADPNLARSLARLYVDAKQYDHAAQLLQPLADQNATDAQLHFDYGSALAHQHKYPEAQAELLKAVQLKPDLVEAYFDLAYAAQQNKNYELTVRVLDARGKLQPDTPATYFLRAEAYDSLRMYKPAAENYKQFLRIAGGKFPDQEFQARHRLKAIEPN